MEQTCVGIFGITFVIVANKSKAGQLVINRYIYKRYNMKNTHTDIKYSIKHTR